MATYRFQRAFTPSPDQGVLRFLRGRIDDYLAILETHLSSRDFVIGAEPIIADISMVGYLLFPTHECGYELTATHPSIAAWLSRVAALPGWRAPYDLLLGTRMRCYVGTGAERYPGAFSGLV